MRRNNHEFTSLIEYYDHVQSYPLKEYEYSKYDKPVEKYMNEWIDYESRDILYFIMNPLNFAVKIGITTNFRARYQTLCSATGLNLIKLCHVGMEPHYDESAKIVETHLHNFFYKKRLAGEWFKLTISDLKMIRDFIFYKFDEIYYDTEEVAAQLKNHKIKFSEIKTKLK